MAEERTVVNPVSTEEEPTAFFGSSFREAFAKKLRHSMIKRGEFLEATVIHEVKDAEEQKAFYRELHKYNKKRQDVLERQANSFSDDDLARLIPRTIHKYLSLLSSIWLEKQYVGAIDLVFQDRNHVKALWVLSEMTLGSYGRAEDIADGKIKEYMPAVSYLERNNPDLAEFFTTVFPRVEINEELCKTKMPVHIRVLSGESDTVSTGQLPMQVTMLYNIFQPAVYEATENMVPPFLEKRLLASGGEKMVRRHLAQSAIYDASVKVECDLMMNEQVKEEMEKYVENNDHGELVIEVMKPIEDTDGVEEQIRARIFFVPYPNDV